LPDGQIFTSAYTLFDGIAIERDAQGRGQATVVFEKLPLMKGRFSMGAYLFDERALHVYDVVLQAATVNVVQAVCTKALCNCRTAGNKKKLQGLAAFAKRPTNRKTAAAVRASHAGQCNPKPFA
jgi:hypothetical protein